MIFIFLVKYSYCITRLYEYQTLIFRKVLLVYFSLFIGNIYIGCVFHVDIFYVLNNNGAACGGAPFSAPHVCMSPMERK